MSGSSSSSSSWSGPSPVISSSFSFIPSSIMVSPSFGSNSGSVNDGSAGSAGACPAGNNVLNVNGNGLCHDDPFQMELEPQEQEQKVLQDATFLDFETLPKPPCPIPMMSSMSFAPGPPPGTPAPKTQHRSKFDDDKIRLQRIIEALADTDTKPEPGELIKDGNFFKLVGSPQGSQVVGHDSPDSCSQSQYINNVPIHVRKLMIGDEDRIKKAKTSATSYGNGKIDAKKAKILYDRQFILYWGLKKLGQDPVRPYVCPVPGCDKTYKNDAGLKYHADFGPHAPVQNFQCVSCEKSYGNRTGLLNHRRKNHELLPTQKRVKPKPKVLNVQDYIKAFNENQAKMKKRRIEIEEPVGTGIIQEQEQKITSAETKPEPNDNDDNEDNTIKLYYYNYYNCCEKGVMTTTVSEETDSETEPIDLSTTSPSANRYFKGDDFTMVEIKVVDTDTNGKDKNEDK